MPKAGWLTLLQLGQQTTYTGPQTTQANIWTLPLINDPPISPIAPNALSGGLVRDGSNIEQEEYQGLNKDVNLTPTKAGGRMMVAMTGAQCALSPRAVRWVMRSLLQSNSADAVGGVNVTQDLDYLVAATTQWYTMNKQMGTGASKSITAIGMVVNRVAIDCPANSVGTLTFDAIGYTEQSLAAQASQGALTDQGLCTSDALFDWDSDLDMGPISFNLEFNNNAFPVFVDSDVPDAIMVGPLTVTGSATFEHFEQIAKMEPDARAGLIKACEVTWGTTSVDGFLEIAFDAKIIPSPALAEADGFEQITLNFEGKQAASPEAWTVITCDSATFPTLV